MVLRFVGLVLLVMGCSGVSVADAGAASATCTVSTCDEAVGTWDVVTPADGGTPCSAVRLPTVTIFRDQGALCTAAAGPLSHPTRRVLSSNGGCGLTLRLTEVPESQGLYVAADQTWAFVVVDGGFAGTNEAAVCCDLNCNSTTQISGTRR